MSEESEETRKRKSYTVKLKLEVCEYAEHSSESASSQPCSSSAADDLDLEMCVDEIDESKDENNEVFVEADDDSDTD